MTREAQGHEAFAEIRRRTYIGRPECFEALDRHVAGDGGPLLLLGESGSGKSALLANWLAHWRQDHPKDCIVQHYIGGTADSADHWRLIHPHGRGPETPSRHARSSAACSTPTIRPPTRCSTCEHLTSRAIRRSPVVRTGVRRVGRGPFRENMTR